MNIFVTGANRGLGLAFIKKGLENGHQMFAGVRNLDVKKIHPLKELQKMYEGQLHLVKLDVTEDSSVEEAAKKVEEKVSQIDCIINNAGILIGRNESIDELDLEKCLTSFEINTLGPVRVTKHLLSLLRKSESPAVVNISSDAASITKAYAKDYPYGLSKIALNLFSEKLKHELKEDSVRIYSIHPGWMKTDMGGESAPLNPIESAEKIYDIIEQRKEVESPSTYINYLGQPMDL